MKNTAVTFDRWVPGTSPRALSEALFDGALVVFDGLRPLARLVDRARVIVAQAFETPEPSIAERHLSASSFRRRALRAREAVASDATVARCWWDTLTVIGYRREVTWLDRIRLRVVPSRDDIDHQLLPWNNRLPGAPATGDGCSMVDELGRATGDAEGSGCGALQTVPPHRDTWGSGIMAQVNWWLPLYPLADTRTMLLWPDAFRRPIANTSGEWNFDTFRNRGQRDYPLLPVARVRPAHRGVPVLIEAGQLLGFSAAHLHAGVSDASGRTRLGVDTRSVWEPDRNAGRGAPNVDGAARAEMWRWFRGPRVNGER